MVVSANDNHNQEPLEKTEGWKFQSFIFNTSSTKSEYRLGCSIGTQHRTGEVIPFWQPKKQLSPMFLR